MTGAAQRQEGERATVRQIRPDLNEDLYRVEIAWRRGRWEPDDNAVMYLRADELRHLRGEIDAALSADEARP